MNQDLKRQVKIKNFYVFFIFFSALLIFAGTYFAGYASAMQRNNFSHRKFMMHCKGHMGFAMFNPFMLKRKLHLTKKQISLIKAAKKEEFKSISLKNKPLKSPMFNALKSGNFNKSVFIESVTQNVKNMAETKADFLSKFFNILTPSQRTKFISLMKNRIKNKIKHLEFMKKMLNRKINIMRENLAQ